MPTLASPPTAASAAGRASTSHPVSKRAARAAAWPTETLLILATRIRRIVCSEPWLDPCRSAVITGRIPYDPITAAGLTYGLHHAEIYPPGGPTTLMIRCAACHKHVPPQVIRSSGHCDDCYYNALPAPILSHLPSCSTIVRMKTRDALAHGLHPGRPTRSRRLESESPQRLPRRRPGRHCIVRVPSRGLHLEVPRDPQTTADSHTSGFFVTDEPEQLCA